jgi:predicted ester cyclase
VASVRVSRRFRLGNDGVAVHAAVKGDKVAVRQTCRGTHTSHFLQIPPTGKQVTFTSIEIYRVSGGKLAEEWVELDMLGLLQQIGVAPPGGG